MGEGTPPEDVAEALLVRGLEAEERGDIDAAVAAYREAAGAGSADAACRLGRWLKKRKDYSGAIRAYEQASAAGNIQATLDLADLFDADGQLDKARSLYEAAIERGELRAMFALGFMLWRAGDSGGARAAFQRAIDAGEPRGHLELGFLLADEHPDGEEPLVAFKRAAALEVEEAWTQVGWQLARLGEVEEAEPVLRGAYEAGDLVAGDVLRDVLEALGREEEAQALYADVAERAANEVSLEYRDLLAMLNGEDPYVDELAWWVEEEAHTHSPLPVAALMFDSPRLAQAETQLTLDIEAGLEEPVELLASLYEKTGRASKAQALRDKG